MASYNVEFTTTLTVEAQSQSEAVETATRQLEEEMQTEGVQQFYVYVDHHPYN